MIIKKLMVALLFITILSACAESDESVPDNCLRAEIFKQCMAAIPNNLHDANFSLSINACDSAALYQSKRRTSLIKKECRAY